MSLSLRNTTAEDKWILFDWTNDEATRANSFSSAAIFREEHSAWFDQSLNDRNKIHLMCQWQGKNTAIVKFEVKGDVALVGINMNPEMRGKGLSHTILQEAVRHYFLHFKFPVKAMIKPGNIASVKAFQKAGFKQHEDEAVQGHRALVFMKNPTDL